MGGARGGVEGIPAANVPEASDLPKFCELMVKQTGFFFLFSFLCDAATAVHTVTQETRLA